MCLPGAGEQDPFQALVGFAPKVPCLQCAEGLAPLPALVEGVNVCSALGSWIQCCKQVLIKLAPKRQTSPTCWGAGSPSSSLVERASEGQCLQRAGELDPLQALVEVMSKGQRLQGARKNGSPAALMENPAKDQVCSALVSWMPFKLRLDWRLKDNVCSALGSRTQSSFD